MQQLQSHATKVLDLDYLLTATLSSRAHTPFQRLVHASCVDGHGSSVAVYRVIQADQRLVQFVRWLERFIADTDRLVLVNGAVTERVVERFAELVPTCRTSLIRPVAAAGMSLPPAPIMPLSQGGSR